MAYYYGSSNLSDQYSSATDDGNPNNATRIPNRIFVGGISRDTTEFELNRFFSAFGHVRSTKIIFDAEGNSKCYGFVTFESEEEAQRVQQKLAYDVVILNARRLNIGPAIKRNGAALPSSPTEINRDTGAMVKSQQAVAEESAYQGFNSSDVYYGPNGTNGISYQPTPAAATGNWSNFESMVYQPSTGALMPYYNYPISLQYSYAAPAQGCPQYPY